MTITITITNVGADKQTLSWTWPDESTEPILRDVVRLMKEQATEETAQFRRAQAHLEGRISNFEAAVTKFLKPFVDEAVARARKDASIDWGDDE